MFFRSLPGLKRTVLPGVIATSTPVLGLRPTPFFLSRTWKTPKPRSSMRLPSQRAFFIASMMVSTASAAFTRGTSVISATRSTMSDLIISAPETGGSLATTPWGVKPGIRPSDGRTRLFFVEDTATERVGRGGGEAPQLVQVKAAVRVLRRIRVDDRDQPVLDAHRHQHALARHLAAPGAGEVAVGRHGGERPDVEAVALAQ